jgi:hypothetical protein
MVPTTAALLTDRVPRRQTFYRKARKVREELQSKDKPTFQVVSSKLTYSSEAVALALFDLSIHRRSASCVGQ